MTTRFVEKSARLVAVLLVPMAAGWAAAAHAQDRDHVVLGVGVAATPTYQGSDDYRVLPLPAIDIKQGVIFANLRNGIGAAPIDTKAVTIGASVVFVQGYRRRDVPDGIDRLSDGVGGRVFANVRMAGFIANIGTTKGISGGTEGLIADASLSYPVRISPRFALTPTIGTTWANRKHNDGYFGVSPAEAPASGLPQFAAGSGFKDASAAITASYRLTNRIMLTATGSATSLLGPVKDSPLVIHKTQPVGIFALTYRL